MSLLVTAEGAFEEVGCPMCLSRRTASLHLDRDARVGWGPPTLEIS